MHTWCAHEDDGNAEADVASDDWKWSDSARLVCAYVDDDDTKVDVTSDD